MFLFFTPRGAAIQAGAPHFPNRLLADAAENPAVIGVQDTPRLGELMLISFQRAS